MNSLICRLQLLVLVCLGLALTACGGGGSSSGTGSNSSSSGSPATTSNTGGGSTTTTPSGTSTPSQPLSADQAAFEQFALQGGAFLPEWNFPFGGGALASGQNWFYSYDNYSLTASPATGTQTSVPTATSLDAALAVPPLPPYRILQNGQIVAESALAPTLVSYQGSGVRVDYLSNDGTQVLRSTLFSNFSNVALSGYMSNAPQQLLSAVPLEDWIKFGNFSATAQWNSGSAYVKVTSQRIGTTYLAVDCSNSLPLKTTTGANIQPCASGATLDTVFPITQLNSAGHPAETDFAADGTITMVQGVRMWIASSPLPEDTSDFTSYRTYFELNGNVYEGYLEPDGTVFNYPQADGSVVPYHIMLNQAANSSLQQGLITGASIAGAQGQQGDTSTVSTVDLFGIGGHAINGALAPADLLSHYDIPGSLSGAGQTIAIVDAPGSGNAADDLNTFSQVYGLPQCTSGNPCFQHIDLSNGAPVLSSNDWGAEIALDTQMAHAIAPGATIILVTAASSSSGNLFKAINYAAALPGVTAVSLSFGNTSFSTLAAESEDATLSGFQSQQGIAFFASSGDAGYLSNGSYPAVSPYVTAVGGTRITSIPWSSTTSEVAWQFSGGGASTYALMPGWQSGYLGLTASLANGGMRAVPDVAAVADSQHSAFAIYYKDQWYMAGGTSAAAPFWAGVSALFGQYLANKGSSLPGLVESTQGGFNGLLYQAKALNATSLAFHDILAGSNDLTANSCTICSAAIGYDDVTGLGVPDVNKLFLTH